VDYDSLVVLFRRIILASSPFFLGGCPTGSSSYCPPDQQTTRPVVEGDAGRVDGGISDLVARCRASSDDCRPLCERVLYGTGSPAGQIKQCELMGADGDLTVHIVYAAYCLGGRRPGGLGPAGDLTAARSALGGWLAGNAHLEAASIDAFEILAAELQAHRGPLPLVRAARTAAGDERRHARVMARLAARHGATPPAVTLARTPIRDIETIARENAIEGCIRETFAALVAVRQARAAREPAIRAAMAGIARDETRHAALSWAVDGWSRGLLGPAARRRVREARRAASVRLVQESLLPTSPILCELAGLPDPAECARMAGALHEQLG
jgi:hypothetical protein